MFRLALTENQLVEVDLLATDTNDSCDDDLIGFSYDGEVICVTGNSVLVKNIDSSTDEVEHQQ
jgi:hypothetical protein